MKDDAYAYIKKDAFVTTQAGSRPLNKEEERLATAYLLGTIVKNPTHVGTTMIAGLAIVVGVVVGIAAYLSFIF